MYGRAQEESNADFKVEKAPSVARDDRSEPLFGRKLGAKVMFSS